MALQVALAKVRDAPFILDAIRAADALTTAAGQDSGPHAVKVLTAAIDERDDQLIAIAAVHALGAVFDDGAAAALSDLLSDPRLYLREHAAWALGSRTPRLDAVGRLVSGVAHGGFATVINQRALRRWAQISPDHIALALEGALLSLDDPIGRARLVETMGLVPGTVATRTLRRVAIDEREPLPARLAAVAAFGDRGDDGSAGELIRRLAQLDGELGAVARLAAFDLSARDLSSRNLADHGAGPAVHLVPGPGRRESGLTVAQLFLHADLDRELSRAGAGDNGGIATMLVRLGDALAAEPGISRVLTMSRGSVDAALDALADPSTGHVLAPIPLMSEPTDASSAWPVSVAAERGIRRALTAHGRVDVVHLRMADVGSMAAAAVATRLGIPTVFTLAPDPHAVIHALDMTGALTRSTFGSVDEREHYWFRTGLVRRLAAGAHHCALFPRPKLRDQLRDLLGVDIDQEPDRYTVVPEGIDISVTAAAASDVRADRHAAGSATTEQHPSLADLAALIDGLPAHRRGLPIALSVGRLHRVKGMATVVEAWASDPVLRERCNLIIVGGDLQQPSGDEQGQLDFIAGVLADNPGAAAGLIVPGHRLNDVVARWMAAAQLGLRDLIAPNGVYVCGSLKEEFGLALIEALAAGLVVVGPEGGGPATYIDQGVTGFLVDTRAPRAVGAGIVAALDLVRGPDDERRVATAQSMVADRFTIEAMAHSLADVYAGVAAPRPNVGRVMTLLVISPDYASHLLPLATLATAWRDAGDQVVVASGPATATMTAEFGFDRRDLRLGRGSNPGVIRAENQVAGEDDALRGFFEATERGMVETLLYQANARSADLLWDPVNTARRVLEVVRDVRPDHVIVDHLAFSARLALMAADVPHADVVLGHPSALPVGDEIYGYPPAWPKAFEPDQAPLDALLRRCRQVRDDFTGQWNAALETLAPQADPSADAFTEHSDLLLLNYPGELHDPSRTAQLPPAHAFLGSAVREQQLPPDIADWLATDPSTPLIYVSFGSFLSVRGDVLARVVEALRPLPVRVVLAVGSADPAVIGQLPDNWLAREFLPQVGLLRAATLSITHGGNNSVTESLTFGVPMLVLPFSTDQFAGAAAIENAGVGKVLDPNTAGVDDLRATVVGLLAGENSSAAADIGASLTREPGQQRARAAVVGRA